MRRRSWILTLALGGLPAVLAAQGFGLKAGASFGNVSNRGVLPGDLGRRTGWAGGLYLTSGSLVGIGVEGLYAQRGLVADGASPEPTRLDYADVPLYLQVQLPLGPVRPFAYAGPQVSYELRCRTAGGDPCAETSERRKWDYAGIIGAGIRLGGNLRFGLEGRYVYGLRDLRLSTITSSESYKTRSFMILGSIGR